MRKGKWRRYKNWSQTEWGEGRPEKNCHLKPQWSEEGQSQETKDRRGSEWEMGYGGEGYEYIFKIRNTIKHKVTSKMEKLHVKYRKSENSYETRWTTVSSVSGWQQHFTETLSASFWWHFYGSYLYSTPSKSQHLYCASRVLLSDLWSPVQPQAES